MSRRFDPGVVARMDQAKAAARSRLSRCEMFVCVFGVPVEGGWEIEAVVGAPLDFVETAGEMLRERAEEAGDDE